MMKLIAAAAFVALTSAQVPPTPCPAAPANYCDCGLGDHGYKWLCRANNGYTWETNDGKPQNPCPCKYKACTLTPARVTPTFFASLASARLNDYCLHKVDSTDDKCYEACSARKFK